MKSDSGNRANPRVAWTLLVAALLSFATALSGALTDGGQGSRLFAIATGVLVLITTGHVVYAHIAASRQGADETDDNS